MNICISIISDNEFTFNKLEFHSHNWINLGGKVVGSGTRSVVVQLMWTAASRMEAIVSGRQRSLFEGEIPEDEEGNPEVGNPKGSNTQGAYLAVSKTYLWKKLSHHGGW